MSRNYEDFDWCEFTEQMFSQPARDPFTYNISFLEAIDGKKLSGLLGAMLIQGVRKKYNKEIAQLTSVEIDEIQKYYHSIGYQVSYRIEKKIQPDTEVPINLFQIDFQPYPQQRPLSDVVSIF
jgi:hypothetical protein